MNLDKYSTKESLEALIQNKDEFLNVVIESTGFILEMLKNNNVKPELDMLIDNLSPFTIQYITDNYQLNSKQTEKIKIFLTDEDTIYNKKLTSQEVEEYLMNEKALPYRTEISVEQINKYYKQIEKQFNIDGNNMEDILNASFRKFKMEDVFKLENEFVLKNSYILDNNPAFFNDEKYREFYKDIIFKAHKKPTIKYFWHYHFKQDDKKFLVTLLENEGDRIWRDAYNDYSKIPGFTNLIDKYEFFLKFGKGDIEHFSDAEVENNAEVFKKAYLEDQENRYSYEAFDNIFRKKMSVKKFKTIFDEEFVSEYFEIISDSEKQKVRRFFGHVDAEYDKSVVDKQAYLARIIAGLFAENKEMPNGKKMTDIADAYNVFQLREILARQRNSPIDSVATLEDTEKLEAHYYTIFNNVMPASLKNENLEEFLSHAKEIVNPLTIKFAEDFFKNNVNINNFTILAAVHEENRDKHFHDYNKSEFMNRLTNYMSTMHEALIKNNNHDELVSVRAILDSIKTNKKNEEDKFIKELLKNTPKRKGFTTPDEYNFLAFETNGIDKLEMWSTVYEIRPDLVDYILKNNIIPPTSFINHCLYNIDNGQKNMQFLKEFAQKNREYIEHNADLLASFLASSRQEEIFPQNDATKIEIYFKEVLELLNRSRVANAKKGKISKLFPRHDMPYSNEGKYPEIDIEKFDENIEIAKDLSLKEAKALYLYLYSKQQLLEKKLDTTGKVIPYSFIVEKLEKYVEQKDFDTVLALDKARIKYSKQPFIDYVNKISFEELKDNLNSSAFFTLLKESINYDNETKIQFPKFTYEQNMELSVVLLDKYKEVSESESFRYSYKFLHFFAQENRDFIKEFVIENFPISMFYGYDFRPEGSDSFKDNKFIKGTYSNEEIYRAFLNLENNGGFLSYKDVNADYKNLFAPVFFPGRRSNKQNQTDEKYKSFLSFIKDKSPVLYLLVANEEIFSSVLDYGRAYGDDTPTKYRSRCEAAHNYFLDNFDIDTILKGVTEVADRMAARKLDKDGQDIINKKLASYAISRMIMHTYYDYYDNGYKEIYDSNTSHEDTLKLMKVLFEKAPLHFIERSRIGQAMDTVGFFKANIDEFYDFEKIKNFIFPNSEVHCEYFNLEDSHGNESRNRIRLLEFTKIIIETAVEKRDTKMIDFMNHAISQHKFINKEMKSNHRYAAYEGIFEGCIDAISKDTNITNLLSNAKLKMDLDGSLVVNAPVKRKNKL